MQHDDAVNSESYDAVRSIANGRDVNGCPIAATMFTKVDGTGGCCPPFCGNALGRVGETLLPPPLQAPASSAVAEAKRGKEDADGARCGALACATVSATLACPHGCRMDAVRIRQARAWQTTAVQAWVIQALNRGVRRARSCPCLQSAATCWTCTTRASRWPITPSPTPRWVWACVSQAGVVCAVVGGIGAGVKRLIGERACTWSQGRYPQQLPQRVRGSGRQYKLWTPARQMPS